MNETTTASPKLDNQVEAIRRLEIEARKEAIRASFDTYFEVQARDRANDLCEARTVGRRCY